MPGEEPTVNGGPVPQRRRADTDHVDRNRTIRRVVVASAAVVALALPGCGGEEEASPTPTPTTEGGGIRGPADKARDTVDELNEQQRERERQTGDYDY